MKSFALTLCATLCLFLTPLSGSHAAPAGAEGDNFIYIIEPGDTLTQLAELYTSRAQLWRQLQDINQISDDRALTIGSALKIPFELIPVVATEAKLTHSKGPVWVNDRLVSQSIDLKSGDTIRTGDLGFATLQLEDQSTLSLPSNSQLHIKQLNAFERARLTDAILDLQSGSLEARVTPNKQGVGRFEVQTPISVTGVRGTDLRVHAHQQMTNTELLSGKAQFSTKTESNQPLKAAEGVSVSSDGSSKIVPLLAAPQLSEPKQGPQGWQSTLTPVAGADYYAVQITLDPEGTQVVRQLTIPSDQTTVPLLSSGPGDHYAFVRAVDEYGLMGLNASLAFQGQLTLVSSSGTLVQSQYGLPILLNDY